LHRIALFQLNYSHSTSFTFVHRPRALTAGETNGGLERFGLRFALRQQPTFLSGIGAIHQHFCQGIVCANANGEKKDGWSTRNYSRANLRLEVIVQMCAPTSS
jgi:hypothetical protein